MAYWEAESNREQEREIDRMHNEFLAQERMSIGVDPY
jgi:hypothetical protein